MDRLIKGLADVALGVGDRDRRRHDEDDASRGDQDERSRSTWAQVVSSGEHDDNEEQGIQGQQYRSNHQKQQHHYQQSQQQQQRPVQQEHCAPNDAWRRNPAQAEASAGAGTDGGDWETVGERRHGKENRRPQKVPDGNWHAFKQNPSEQHYHEESHGLDTKPSPEELHDLSKACNRLWELDANRLVPGKHYEIDCGDGKKVYQQGDMAAANLFSWLSDDALRRPTFSRFCSLLDNYNPNQGCKEVVTAEEKNEQVAFMEEISRTAPIKYLHMYLVEKGVVSRSEEEFKKMMMSLWFGLHGRAGTAGCSSAFEHVFVGEIKGRGQSEVSGFHNWIQFYLEEAKGAVDYQGYIFPRRRGECPDSETQLLTIQFEWNGVLKSVSSTLVGVSPEFEVALYTLCFFMGGEDNHIDLGPYQVNVKCYRMGNDRIGSVFPIAE